MMNKGKSISEADAMIAATAMWSDYVLVTDDKDFLPIPGLSLENWRT
jgi:predicted nucleic acid-binding protein